MDTTNTKLKVVMFPWLAHGHVSPYLELSKRLIDRNFFIYFCSTPIILTSINQKINEKQALSMQLVELHLTPSVELPPHRHTTKDLPPHLVRKLGEAFALASPSFSLILHSLKPDLVVYDMFPPWVPAISTSHNIPAVQFLTSGVAMMEAGVVFKFKCPEKEFPFPELKPRYFPEFFIRGVEMPPEIKKKYQSEIIESLTGSTEIVLIKTFEELEGKYFDYLYELVERKVVPVGPLIDVTIPSKSSNENDEIMTWLDKKDKRSTVYVSFGSERFLTKEEIQEVAFGLELSNVDFLWVLRFSAGNETNAEEALPKGFIQRVGERGMIWQKWAPQMEILAHPSIGGFVTHCGWSSITESINMGVPIIAVPLHVDQPFNARLIEEVGVGVEVGRDEKNATIKGEEIAKTIRKVVVEKDGESVRQKAKEFSNVMKLKEEERVDVVVEELTRLCKKKYQES